MATNYAQQLIADIINANKKSIRFSTPLNIQNVEVREDTEYGIGFYNADIAVKTLSLRKNIFGEYKILVANGQHKISSITKESYDAIKRVKGL